MKMMYNSIYSELWRTLDPKHLKLKIMDGLHPLLFVPLYRRMIRSAIQHELMQDLGEEEWYTTD